MSISPDKISKEANATKPSSPAGPDLSTGAQIGLRIVSSGDVISLLGRDNFTLGRSIEGQAVIPDVDLAKFDAYDQGISRMHAELRLEKDGIFLIDLDSANGTIVNGKRIKDQETSPLYHGDIIQLGRLRLQIISQQTKGSR
jgi:pSer/pThr/pTyr-binding forkhead associated (FHA) protein